MNSRDGLNKDSGSARGARDCQSLQIKYLASTGHPSRKKKGRSSVNKSWKKDHQVLSTLKSKRCPQVMSISHRIIPVSSSKQGREPSSVTVTVQGNQHLLPPPSPLHPGPPPGLAQRLLRPTGSMDRRSASHHPPSLPPFPPCLPRSRRSPLLNHRQSDLPCPASLFYQFAPFFRACRLPISS